ncbi:MAG: hypothetical protein IPK16_10355 [Anaerolineales bacterium]|nr:hypothetical protein [Anaerolineales bacterium]
MQTSKVCSATILSVLLAIVLLAGCGPTTHPTDEQLLERFSQNEAGFDQLVTMLQEDPELRRVDDDWTDPADPSMIGVSEDRIVAYRARFKQLGIPRGFYAFHDPEDYTFVASALGLSVSGSSKGLCLSRRTA